MCPSQRRPFGFGRVATLPVVLQTLGALRFFFGALELFKSANIACLFDRRQELHLSGGLLLCPLLK